MIGRKGAAFLVLVGFLFHGLAASAKVTLVADNGMFSLGRWYWTVAGSGYCDNHLHLEKDWKGSLLTFAGENRWIDFNRTTHEGVRGSHIRSIVVSGDEVVVLRPPDYPKGEAVIVDNYEVWSESGDLLTRSRDGCFDLYTFSNLDANVGTVQIFENRTVFEKAWKSRRSELRSSP